MYWRMRNRCQCRKCSLPTTCSFSLSKRSWMFPHFRMKRWRACSKSGWAWVALMRITATTWLLAHQAVAPWCQPGLKPAPQKTHVNHSGNFSTKNCKAQVLTPSPMQTTSRAERSMPLLASNSTQCICWACWVWAVVAVVRPLHWVVARWPCCLAWWSKATSKALWFGAMVTAMDGSTEPGRTPTGMALSKRLKSKMLAPIHMPSRTTRATTKTWLVRGPYMFLAAKTFMAQAWPSRACSALQTQPRPSRH